ncbi:MAG: NAD-dependent epimerase/dehydratase family protein, partial [Saprospiraceae bacterium]
HLYGIPCTGLRFFTVYGPWGRPDMAVLLFARAIEDGTPIRLFNNGDLRRDFTYIDDIVEGVCRVAELAFEATLPPYRLYNIGRGQPARLMSLVAALERELGRKAILDPQPMQPGDVYQTYADTAALQAAIGYAPSISLEEGIARFAAWWKRYSR